MKKRALLFMSLLLFVVFAAVQVSTQEQRELRAITVRSGTVSNGVVILAVQEGNDSFELQCNKDVSGCTVLKPGEYSMIRLPKNHGLYDCANVEIYRKSADAETGDRLGQYCLVGAK
jgi:hypothetical protein